jgi:hypothetical protein
VTVFGGDIIYAADINDWRDGPCGRLVASGAQTLTDNTAVAILWAAEDRDTGSWHSTSVNTSRVTPTKSGILRVHGTLFLSTLVNGVTVDVNVRLNGVTNLAPGNRLGGAAAHGVAASAFSTANAFSVSTTAQIEVNGTTDYFELVGRQNSGGDDDTNQSSQFSSVLEWEYLRPL